MIPVTVPTTITNLAELQWRVANHGGSIVAYQRVLSAVVASVATTEHEWVPPGTSAVRAGLRHTLVTLVCGWWSISGFLWTITALIHNLGGGHDMTPLLAPGPATTPEDQQRALERIERAADRTSAVMLVVCVGVLAVLVRYCVVPYWDEFVRAWR